MSPIDGWWHFYLTVLGTIVLGALAGCFTALVIAATAFLLRCIDRSV